MKKIEYSCNLCNEIKLSKDLLCFYFASGRVPEEYVLNANIDGSDKHLCKKCISIIKGSTATTPL